MQIRERGMKIELLRSFYDPGKKRSGQIMVGAMLRYLTAIPPDLERQLSPEESDQVRGYLAEKEAERVQPRIRTHIRDLKELEGLIRSHGVAEEQVRDIREGVAKILEALGNAKVD